MKSYPGLLTPTNVAHIVATCGVGLKDGRYVPARPLPFYGGPLRRIKLAWLVFTGKADALVWEKQP